MNLRTGLPSTKRLHIGVGERGRAHERLVGVGGHGDAAAQLAIDLHDDLDRSRARAQLSSTAGHALVDDGVAHGRARATARGMRAARSAQASAPTVSSASCTTARPCAERSSKRASAFRSSITAAIAVLKVRRRPMSAVTLASVSCTCRRMSRCRASSVARSSARRRAAAHVCVHGLPEPLHETVGALHALVRPLERLLGRRSWTS